jgi:hypothetical protein
MRPNLGFGLPCRVAVANSGCRWQAVYQRLSHGFFIHLVGFSIVTLGLHLAVDVRDTALCFIDKALHFYGGGSFLTLALALYRVNPLLGRLT